MAQLRLREACNDRVALAARLRHLLRQFPLPFVDKGVALGESAGDLSGELLLPAEIGVKPALGFEQALARIEQFDLGSEVLRDEPLIHALLLADQLDLPGKPAG